MIQQPEATLTFFTTGGRKKREAGERKRGADHSQQTVNGQRSTVESWLKYRMNSLFDFFTKIKKEETEKTEKTEREEIWSGWVVGNIIIKYRNRLFHTNPQFASAARLIHSVTHFILLMLFFHIRHLVSTIIFLISGLFLNDLLIYKGVSDVRWST